ncbi:hypothetical protein KDM87_17315 [Undibacterium sp. FT147W]|uniref:Uncharacterized protein n=1 Tax=Undibacterium rivi TaxID=2828729 RepID=A0ABS5H6A7_9BURK|nr:hypothetical protein [Undibacterium rivi]MBR7794358.1 hypothetical protein [Undibacterium rivi]
MAHLTDMEEILSRIPGTDIRDYMREAMGCYMAGAYRGTLVLSYIALFDDLLAKLDELGNVNTAAKSIFTEATKKKSDQDVYESYLIDQLTSKSFISGLDSSFLTTLRTLRNKSAHPSGHKPSPEEARFVFFETIDRFLSKPILSTTQLVDELVTRLKNSNFFPSTSIVDIRNVVRDELTNLHDEAMPQLVTKMAAAITSPDGSIKKNSSYFLIGLSKLDKLPANVALQTKLIASKADNSDYEDVIIQALSANGKLISGLSGTPVERVRAILAKKISEITSTLSETNLIHPTSALISLAEAISESEFLEMFKPEVEALFKKRAHSEFVVKLVKDKPSLLPIYLPILISKAGSSDFATANSFSNSVEALDGALGEILTSEQSLQLIVAMIRAANSGAWSAKAEVSAKFANVPTLRSKAIEFTTANEMAAATLIKDKLDESKSVNEFVAATLTDETV